VAAPTPITARAGGPATAVIAAEWADEVRHDPAKIGAVQRIMHPTAGFRVFLNYWRFRDQESGEIRMLGDVLWQGQEEFIRHVAVDRFMFALKARKLGFTTIEQAFDGYCSRWRWGAANSRVHLFSRRADAADELLEAVVFGLDGLPAWMQLPKVKATQSEVRYQAEEHDIRILKAYPADEETAVEATCNHGHVDEWARMGNPRKVWQAIEPSMAGTAHIITTGLGPNNYSSDFYKAAIAGENVFVPVFIGALNRPDRDANWLAEKMRTMPELERKHEYPMAWEEALYGGADLMFEGMLDAATRDAYGPQLPKPGHRYVKAWDIGRHKDAAVCVVLDITGDVIDVVHYVRLRRQPYPVIQARIEAVHAAYPGLTVIEKNAAGEAVAENLNMRPGQDYELFFTSQPSKARILQGTRRGFMEQVLKYSAKAWPQLDSELKAYMLPDDRLVQDSVMALAIGYEHIGHEPPKGRIGRIQRWG